jgi:hypothetical protein
MGTIQTLNYTPLWRTKPSVPYPAWVLPRRSLRNDAYST